MWGQIIIKYKNYNIDKLEIDKWFHLNAFYLCLTRGSERKNNYIVLWYSLKINQNILKISLIIVKENYIDM